MTIIWVEQDGVLHRLEYAPEEVIIISPTKDGGISILGSKHGGAGGITMHNKKRFMDEVLKILK